MKMNVLHIAANELRLAERLLDDELSYAYVRRP